MENELEPLLTEEQVAQLLGVSKMSVTRLRKAGKISYLKMGRPRFRRSDVEAYFASIEVAVREEKKAAEIASLDAAEKRARVKWLRRSLKNTGGRGG